LAIRATLSRELLDSLQTSLDASVAIAQEPHNTLPPLAMAFEIMDSSGQREGRGVLRVGPEMLSRIEGLSVSWKSEPNPSLASITHSVALCVCAFDISAGELATLRLGDCMILGEVSAWPFPLWISTGAAPIPIGFPPIAALPLSLQSSTPSTMNPTEPATSPLSNLKLPLLVVAGRKEMTLEQLASLRQGASLEIGSGENIPVELEVNNQVVATGHLVRVADKICASITEIRSLPTA
jgi:flagellar motor switch/type III secretory pathway protein FliN